MSLHLDNRHRAMLQEMGVHIWSPKPAPVPLPDAATAQSRSAHAPTPSAAPQPSPAHRPTASHTAPQPPTAAATPVATALGAPLAWTLQVPQPVYPHAAAQATPTEAGPRWLLVAEGAAGTDPLAGDAGGLLDNMLHALHLRQQPQVFICVLTPLATEANGASAAAAAAAAATPDSPCQVLTQAITDIEPAVLLVMGRAAARSVLGRSEPLGQLRSQSHRIAGVPAVVTYDAAYLLRAPSAKAGAWDDLCRARALALALAPPSSAEPVNR